jgi:hypothetical protein
MTEQVRAQNRSILPQNLPRSILDRVVSHAQWFVNHGSLGSGVSI